MTALRALYGATLLLAAVANIVAGVSGHPSDELVYILLGIIGAGVGWFMIGGDR